jgi:2-polyprenyl-3-methyl-5-hydroxy-6-metoxy-1,4-benzoquinol methylase
MQFTPHEIEWTPEKTKRLWDYYGSSPKYAGMFFGYIAGKFAAKRIMADTTPTKDARLLDFSCGRGDVIAACLPLMTGNQEIYATDFSVTHVKHVNERFNAPPRFKGALLTDSLPTRYDTAFFDVIYATEVIEHLLDHELEAMLLECKRLLKPGGRIFFTTPNDEDYDAAKIRCPECGCTFHRWQHVRTWTADSLRAYMERAGFVTRLCEPEDWLNWRGKLMSFLSRRHIVKSGLVYVGEYKR